MKITIDNQIVKSFANNSLKLLKDPLLSSPDSYISFRWPNLLEYLELGSLLSTLPAFDPSHPIFNACISVLHANEEKEALFHMYDCLFVENLNQIKSLPQINASFLVQALKEQRKKSSFLEVEKLLSPTLTVIEASLLQQASHKMHDLTLYLAWDRMCICLVHLFNYQSTDLKFIKGIEVLKECLIESYQHISQQGRTSPGIYRLLESLFFYQMRDENLQKHTDAEWSILSQSFPVLKAQDELADFFYIDDAVTSEEDLRMDDEHSAYDLTLDSQDRVNARLALAQCMMNKLKMEVPQWNYSFRPKNIIYLTL